MAMGELAPNQSENRGESRDGESKTESTPLQDDDNNLDSQDTPFKRKRGRPPKNKGPIIFISLKFLNSKV
jgi:hypothetical protein